MDAGTGGRGDADPTGDRAGNIAKPIPKQPISTVRKRLVIPLIARILPFQNPRSGCKHKAWGEAKRNPRMTKSKETERAKRAIAQTADVLNDE